MSGHEIPDLRGLKSAWQLWHGAEWLGAPRHSFSVRIQQVVSFAGDPARNDIDETKFELEWRDTWGAGHCAKAKAKPVIDWVGRGQTGAALDLEGSWWIGPQWTFALLAGGRLWGEGVPSTFEGRAEIRLVYRYRGVADPAVPSTDRAPMHDTSRSDARGQARPKFGRDSPCPYHLRRRNASNGLRRRPGLCIDFGLADLHRRPPPYQVAEPAP